MAKESRSISFKNAMVDKENDMIIETTKDEVKYFKLSKLVSDWDKVDGISITFKKDNDVTPVSDGEGED